MNKVYISGPITDDPNYEQKFAIREETLRSMGYSVCNPVLIGKKLKYNLRREPEYHEYMKASILALLDCDGISFLDGYEKSKGASLEKEVAEMVGIPTLNIRILDKNW